MRAEKEKLSSTIAQAKKILARKLIQEGCSDEYIARLTKLEIEGVIELRKIIR